MIDGRLLFSFLLVCAVTAFGSVLAGQRDASRTGWISDESCGAEHTKPGRADCVRKCWRGGASVGHPEWKPQRAVFVADDDQRIWIVENPETVKDYPAAHDLVAGKFDSEKKTIHVAKIALSDQPQVAEQPKFKLEVHAAAEGGPKFTLTNLSGKP